MELNAGMMMLVKSLLLKLGVDARKIEDVLTVGTAAANNLTNGVKAMSERMASIESKLDYIIAQLPAKDCGETVAYLSDGQDLKAATGELSELITT